MVKLILENKTAKETKIIFCSENSVADVLTWYNGFYSGDQVEVSIHYNWE